MKNKVVKKRRGYKAFFLGPFFLYALIVAAIALAGLSYRIINYNYNVTAAVPPSTANDIRNLSAALADELTNKAQNCQIISLHVAGDLIHCSAKSTASVFSQLYTEHIVFYAWVGFCLLFIISFSFWFGERREYSLLKQFGLKSRRYKR